MITRRQFVNSVGIGSLLPAVSETLANSRQKPAAPAGGRSRVDLAGAWERHVNGKLWDAIQIPSSQPPLGFYHLKRTFHLPKLSLGQRAFVHFEAITFYGRVAINGTELGSMGPYIPYEFDFTRPAKEGLNAIDVAIADAHAGPSGAGKDEVEYGNTNGWEAYGGIIRDVYVEIRPAAHIENVRFGYELTGDYTSAQCHSQVYVSASEAVNGQLELALFRSGRQVARAEVSTQLDNGESKPELGLKADELSLWSPDEPNLYKIVATLKTEYGTDQYEFQTGFRDVRITGNQFLLNGRALLLNGVCRHDLWKDQGFTLTPSQMAQDLRMIKQLGANFIRLVHYPHHRHIVELADQMGLLVSEEPGYWGADFRTMRRPLIELGLKTMEATIKRDWNSPSVLFWFLGNECRLTVDYLREGKALCNKVDPLARPVSFANDSSTPAAKSIFEQAGMDFFDQHLYTFNLDDYQRTAEIFGSSKPITISEWGGKPWGQSPILLPAIVDRLLALVEQKKISGHFFWEWADIKQYSRNDLATHNGVLEEGVVTEARDERQLVYEELTRLFQLRHREGQVPNSRPKVLPLKWSPWSAGNKFEPVDLQSLVEANDSRRAWAELEDLMSSYLDKLRMPTHWKSSGEKLTFWQDSEVEIMGVNFRFPVLDGYVRPLAITPNLAEITIPVDAECLRLHILGQVTIPGGFPIEGDADDAVGTYTLHFAGGRVREIPLRNGIEVARANVVSGATRFNPVATAAQRALLFARDVSNEQYQVLLFTLPTEGARVSAVSCKMHGQQPLLVFALTAESE